MSPDDVRKALADDYGQYVAKHTIYSGTARAFNEGDPVPASHVARGVVSTDDVVKTSTKAGQAIVAQTQEA